MVNLVKSGEKKKIVVEFRYVVNIDNKGESDKCGEYGEIQRLQKKLADSWKCKER